MNAEVTDYPRPGQHDWIGVFKGRAHIKAGEVSRGFLGYVKEMDFILRAKEGHRRELPRSVISQEHPQ